MTSPREEAEQVSESQDEATITFKTFLEEYPIGASQSVSDYFSTDSHDRYWRSKPQLRLYCRGDECQGYRRFDGKWENGGLISASEVAQIHRDFLVYTCRDCTVTQKTFCLLSGIADADGGGRVMKIGEIPELHIDLPAYLPTLLGEEYKYFIKGLKAEKQALGIGAFTYYRRVVETQKGRIFQKMAEVAKRLNMPQDMIDNLVSASNENQFAKAMDKVKDYIPEAFKLRGQNPMRILYAVISDGIHGKDDDACLEIAHSVRIVIQDMSQRMKDALRDDAEANIALTNLMKRHSGQL